jgi:hypothetical protein
VPKPMNSQLTENWLTCWSEQSAARPLAALLVGPAARPHNGQPQAGANDLRPIVMLGQIDSGPEADGDLVLACSLATLGASRLQAESGCLWSRVQAQCRGASLEHDLVCGMAALALVAVRQTRIQLGDPVLVLGNDPWSLLLLQMARLQGASPLLFATPGENRLGAVARQLGADLLLEGSSHAREAIALSPGEAGYRVVFDAIGTERTLSAGLAAARDGGTYVAASLFGPSPASLNVYADLHRRDLEFVPLLPTAPPPHVWTVAVRRCLAWTRSGRIKLDDVLVDGSGWHTRLDRAAAD